MSDAAALTGREATRRAAVAGLLATAAVLVLLIAGATGGTAAVDRGPGVGPGVGAGPGPALAPAAGANATAADTDAAAGTPHVQAACNLSETNAEPGERVTLFAGDSTNAEFYSYDRDGDGSYEVQFSSDAFQSFTYNQSGSPYSPQVRVTNETAGESDVAACPQLTVAPNDPPTARLNYTPANPTVGEQVTFDATNSSDADGRVEFFSWSGAITVPEDTRGIQYTTFQSPGTYQVTVTVSDDDDAVDDETVTVRVTQDADPTARFTYAPRPAIAGETTTLDASNSTAPGGSIAQYRWDFDGDGTVDNVSTGPITTHVYPPQPDGFQNTRLTVVTQSNRTDRTTRDVIVERPAPVARCTVSPQVVRPGETVVLNASSSEYADEFQFARTSTSPFGNFTNRTTTTVTYASPGNYTPLVRAWQYPSEDRDTNECPTVSVSPNEPPVPRWTYSPSPARPGDTVTFDASNSSDPDGNIAAYRWDFGNDGNIDNTTTRPTTTHTFTEAEAADGFEVVRLVVVDDGNASAAEIDEVQLASPGPTARCSVSQRTVAPGETVTVDASASERADEFQFARTGDEPFGDFRNESTVVVEYEEPGTYTPRVRAWQYPSEQRDTADCPSVTVREPNAPPEADLGHRPTQPATGQAVTFDAAGSIDADGTITTYRWDTDDDGTAEVETGRPTIRRTFGEPGAYRVTVTVVDDDGGTDRASTTVEVRPRPAAACTVEPRTVAPGETVTVDAAGSEQAAAYRFAPTDDDAFGDVRDAPTATVTYDDPGEYTPRVQVLGTAGDLTDVARCPTVTVERENLPPTAAFDYEPDSPSPGESVDLNGTGSSDPDGTVVEYRWDIGADGGVDAVTSDPVLPRRFRSSGERTVVLTVVDNDGATASTQGTIPVGGGLPCAPHCWTLVLPLLPPLATRVFRAPRKIPNLGGAGRSSGEQYAVGSFETPAGSGTVAVDHLGFEPDVVLFTVNNAVRAGGAADAAEAAGTAGASGTGNTAGAARPDGGTGAGSGGRGSGSAGSGPAGPPRGPDAPLAGRSAGLSLGKAVRSGDGIAQNVVSVGDDARSTDAAVGAVHSGKAIDVLVHGDDAVGSLAGAVTRTTRQGFEVTFNADGLPAGADGEGYVVHFQALSVPDTSDVAVGHFTTPAEPGRQTVDLGTDADYVALTACSLTGEMDAAATTGRAVGLSHGGAVQHGKVTVGTESDGATGTGSTGATETGSGRATETGSGSATRTASGGDHTGAESDADAAAAADPVSQQALSGAVTAGSGTPDVRGAHDDRALHVPFLDEGGVAGHTVASVTEVGSRLALDYESVHRPGGTAAQVVVTYVAVAPGEGLLPEMGHVPAPAPGERATVDVGFDPGLVEVTGTGVPEVGREVPVAGALPFDWSFGAAMPTRDGVAEHVLGSSLLTADLPHPSLPSLGAVDPLHLRVTAGGTSADGGTGAGHGDTTPGGASGTGGHGGGSGGSPGSAGSGAEPATSGGASGTDPGDGRSASAVLLSTGDRGEVYGRDEVRVASFTRSGFELATAPRGSGVDAPTGADRPTLFYTAWPKPDGTTDRQSEQAAESDGSGSESDESSGTAGTGGGAGER